MPLPRIAVIGGDERGAKTAWPAGYDVRHFPAMGRGGERKLDAALSSGKYAMLIIMTKWVGHSVTRHATVPTRYWDRGFPELAEQLPTFIAPGDATAAAAGGEVDDHWYETLDDKETAMENQPETPAPKQPKMKIDEAMRVMEREMELLADGLLDESDVLVVVERILQRGVAK